MFGIDDAISAMRDFAANALTKAIENTTRPTDRAEVIGWLLRCRDVLAEDAGYADKSARLYGLVNASRFLEIALNSAMESLRNYKQSSLPLGVKVALPATILAAPFIGAQGAGIAAFGTAIGAPVLLLVFLGTAGISSVIEALLSGNNSTAYLDVIADFLARDEVLAALREAIESGSQGSPCEPVAQAMPKEEAQLRSKLLDMDPFDFERHVMAFFRDAGLIAGVTPKTGDGGIDGFARHPNGCIVVQCKRYSPGNSVGSPAINQFWGAIERHKAFRGYMITTSSFTAAAVETAAASEKIRLIAGEDLIRWHFKAPDFM